MPENPCADCERELKNHDQLCADIIAAGRFPDKDPKTGRENVNADLPRLVGALFEQNHTDRNAALDLLESAWGVIANAGNPLGQWDSLPQQWVDAAQSWRERYHAFIGIKR